MYITKLKLLSKLAKWEYIEPKFVNIMMISVGIDFTARDLQEKLKAKGLAMGKAKAFDGSAVVGEFCQK
jgi:hypothetical protein